MPDDALRTELRELADMLLADGPYADLEDPGQHQIGTWIMEILEKHQVNGKDGD